MFGEGQFSLYFPNLKLNRLRLIDFGEKEHSSPFKIFPAAGPSFHIAILKLTVIPQKHWQICYIYTCKIK